jgi:hypothetical protein
MTPELPVTTRRIPAMTAITTATAALLATRAILSLAAGCSCYA